MGESNNWGDDSNIKLHKFGEEDLDEIFAEEWEDDEEEVSHQLKKIQKQSRSMGSLGEVFKKRKKT